MSEIQIVLEFIGILACAVIIGMLVFTTFFGSIHVYLDFDEDDDEPGD